MGSSSSHLVSSESSSSRKLSGSGGSRMNRTRRKLSSLFCGGFSSPKSTFEKPKDCPEASSINCTKDASPVDGSSSVFKSEAGDTRSMCEHGALSESSSSVVEEPFVESGLSNVQTSGDLETLPHQPAQDSDSGNARDCAAVVVDGHVGIAEGTAITCSGDDQTTSLSISHANPNDLEQNQDAVVGYNDSDLRSLSIASDDMTADSSSGLPVSDSDQNLRTGALLHLDLVSVSSNLLSDSIAELNSSESRRNSRRQFWDALSRHSFRRHTDSPSIVLAAGLADGPGSRDGWLLGFSGNLLSSGIDDHDLDSFSARLRLRSERRWLLRSDRMMSEASVGGPNEGGQQSAFCASGLHLVGACSCDSFFTAEESSSLAGISRIIMLADALFEVLDEIHNQSLSLSPSALSLPAPEAIVDSFPLKYHKKIKNAENGSSDAQQCYICLADYEEGDKLRVLPCNHEYHMPCINKWLKEVNRVCPLCRHDVCEGPGECSVSNT